MDKLNLGVRRYSILLKRGKSLKGTADYRGAGRVEQCEARLAWYKKIRVRVLLGWGTMGYK